MKNKALKSLRVTVAGVIILESLVLAFFMRPIQDDYFNLQSVQEMGVIAYLHNTWDFHGGNMVQFLIHCLMILPSTEQLVFWNFGLFFLVTEVLVFLSVRSINTWLFSSESAVTRFWVPLLSVAGFEGLFVPGFLGAYGFSLASLAHLWPVMAFVTGLIALKKFPGSWLIALMLGLISGNSNLGESAFACGAWLLVWLGFKFISDFQLKSGILKNANFYLLGFGSLIGSIGITAAPGLRERAENQVGLPSSFFDLAKRFVKSFASFTADGITHPMVWVLILLGVLLTLKQGGSLLQVNSYRLCMLGVGALVIWTALIVGSTIAYPAWHQSMGMYILLLPLSFGVGHALKTRFSSESIMRFLIIACLVMSFTFLRIGILGVERSLRWDRNLATNSCLLKENPNANLLGAEIQYPPFGLGVDDVNTWEWMRNKYAGWVAGISEDRCATS